MKRFLLFVFLMTIATFSSASDTDISYSLVSKTSETRSCVGDCAFTFKGGTTFGYQFRRTWSGWGVFLDTAGTYGSLGYGFAVKKKIGRIDIGGTIGQRGAYTATQYAGPTTTSNGDIAGTAPEIGLFLNIPIKARHRVDVRYVITSFDRTINSTENTGTVDVPIYTPRTATVSLSRQYLFVGYALKF